MKEHIEKIKDNLKKFIEEKKVIENAKRYWWAILIGVLVLIYIIGFVFGGPSEEVGLKDTEINKEELETSITYITHPGGDETQYTVEFLMDHVIPSQTDAFIDSLTFTQNPLTDFKEIVRMMRFSKLSDKGRFGVEDYWQTPAEVLVTKEGDNEDWTNTFISAAISYDSSFKCYVVAFETLLTALCYTDNQYIWMDDDETMHSRTITSTDTEQAIKVKMQEMLDMYSKRYRVRAGEKLNVLFAYNNKDFVQFSNNQEFIEWAMALSD